MTIYSTPPGLWVVLGFVFPGLRWRLPGAIIVIIPPGLWNFPVLIDPSASLGMTFVMLGRIRMASIYAKAMTSDRTSSTTIGDPL